MTKPRCIPIELDAVAEARFWAKVQKPTASNAWQPDHSHCWVWTAAKSGAGYGVVGVRNPRRNEGAHRVAYALTIGPIPTGLSLDHLCRNPPCVNPAHLEPVTHQENCRRGKQGQHDNHGPGVRAATAASAAAKRAKTHCVAGHELTPENTYVIKTTGWRQCIPCSRRRKREEHARKTATQSPTVNGLLRATG